jgi:hypothetical protein
MPRALARPYDVTSGFECEDTPREYVKWGGGGVDRRVGVWRKVTGNAIGICASRSLGRTTICWGTGSGRPRESITEDRIAGMDIVGLNLGLFLRNMSAA